MAEYSAGAGQGGWHWLQSRHHPIVILLMGMLTVVLLAATGWRIHRDYSPPGTEFDWRQRGFSDFHNGGYFPAKAFLDGASPYSPSTAERYSMSRATPPYSPIIFILNLPFAFFSLHVARVLFFFFNAGFMVAIAGCSLKMAGRRLALFDLLGITNLLLISRPGHVTLFTGYFTAEIVLGCIAAIHFAKSRPVFSGLGMVLASIKPNFIIPLMILLIFRRNIWAVGYGVLFSAIAAGIGLGWLAMNNGWEQTIAGIRAGQSELHADPTELPVNTWTRVDLLGMYAKLVDWVPDDRTYLIAMMIFLSIIGVVVFRASRYESEPGAAGLTGFLVALAILLGVYHHVYDCLLIAVPVVGIVFFGRQTVPEVPQHWRRVIAFLTTVPAINYLSTKSVMEKLQLEPHGFAWQAVTLINGLCLLAALVILLSAAIGFRNFSDKA